MSDKDDKLRLFGKIWDGLSTPQKLLVSISLLAVLAAAFTGGFWLGDLSGNYKVASAEARYERHITELRSQLAEKSAARGYRLEIKGYDPNADATDLPDLDDAPRDDTSMLEFAQESAADSLVFKEAHEGKTSIQRPEFSPRDVGKRFDWTGYVEDVSGMDGGVELSIYADRKKPSGFRTTCYFTGELRAVFENLETGQEVTVAGVMNRMGSLVRCKLLSVGDTQTPPDQPDNDD